MKTSKKLWIALGVLIILSPLGLILPDLFNSGAAWGEWSKEEVREQVGYVPSGMEKSADKWKAPLPDYALKGQEEAPVRSLSLSYILSAMVGVAVVVGITIVIGKVLARREKSDSA